MNQAVALAIQQATATIYASNVHCHTAAKLPLLSVVHASQVSLWK
jgi:hypothetical protein